MKRQVDAYDRFRNSEWGVALNRRLGSALVECLGRPLRVLDVGCGDHGRFFASFSQATSALDYCSVDLCPRESSTCVARSPSYWIRKAHGDPMSPKGIDIKCKPKHPMTSLAVGTAGGLQFFGVRPQAEPQRTT